MRVWDEKIELVSALFEDEQIKKYLTDEEIKSICNINNRLKNTEYIFKRLGIN
jgi:hypothetical protein